MSRALWAAKVGTSERPSVGGNRSNKEQERISRVLRERADALRRQRGAIGDRVKAPNPLLTRIRRGGF